MFGMIFGNPDEKSNEEMEKKSASKSENKSKIIIANEILKK